MFEQFIILQEEEKMDLTKQVDLTEEIERKLKGKPNDIQKMVLKTLESLLEMRNDLDFFEKTFLLFEPLIKFPEKEKEMLVYLEELKNIALSFSGLTSEEAEDIKDFLQKEIAKFTPLKSKSLETFMRKCLGDVVIAASTPRRSSLSKTILEVFLTIAGSFYDENFHLSLAHPVKNGPEKKQLADRVSKLLSEYCKIQNIQRISPRKPQLYVIPMIPTLSVYQIFILGKCQEEDSTQYSQIFVTVAPDRILVSRKVSRKDFIH